MYTGTRSSGQRDAGFESWAGEVIDQQSGANTEFIGPFTCCDCGREWGHPKDHPALDEGEVE